LKEVVQKGSHEQTRVLAKHAKVNSKEIIKPVEWCSVSATIVGGRHFARNCYFEKILEGNMVT